MSQSSISLGRIWPQWGHTRPTSGQLRPGSTNLTEIGNIWTGLGPIGGRLWERREVCRARGPSGLPLRRMGALVGRDRRGTLLASTGACCYKSRPKSSLERRCRIGLPDCGCRVDRGIVPEYVQRKRRPETRRDARAIPRSARGSDFSGQRGAGRASESRRAMRRELRWGPLYLLSVSFGAQADIRTPCGISSRRWRRRCADPGGAVGGEARRGDGVWVCGKAGSPRLDLARHAGLRHLQLIDRILVAVLGYV